MTRAQRHLLQFEVADDAQAAELNAAWKEIVSGKRARLSTAAEETHDIMERARPALQTLVSAIEQNAGSGQTRRLVRFLAGLYNGHDFPFDLTDLRTLDTELANACIDYLNYDRLGKAEVHSHLPGGGRQMQKFISNHQIRPRLHLSDRNAHEARLDALAGRVHRDREDLLKQALEDVLSRYEAKAFGSLLAKQSAPDCDRPLVHAHWSTDTIPKPLCGATDGPWTARVFDFGRLTCTHCQFLVLTPNDELA